MILIFGHLADPHVANVVQALRDKGAPHKVVDIFGDTPDGLQLGLAGHSQIAIGKEKIPLAEFNSVWWRQKPRFIVPTETPGMLYDYFFVHREWNHLIDFLGTKTTHAFCMNDRERATSANNKLTQLEVASKSNFAIPRTLISNDPHSIEEFLSGGKRYIFKPFTPYMPPDGTITFTTEVSADMVRSDTSGIKNCPGIFQEFIEKEFELRITVVGRHVFAAKINSNYSPTTTVDWRRDQFLNLYTEYHLDDEFKADLLALHKTLGLSFAAYDFIMDKSGQPIFLEVNPSGQWLWLESKLRFPISETIADALIYQGVDH